MDLDGKGMLTPDVMHAGLFAAAWDIDRVFGLFDKVDKDEDGCISKVLLCQGAFACAQTHSGINMHACLKRMHAQTHTKCLRLT